MERVRRLWRRALPLALPAAPAGPVDPISRHVADAADRFGIPARWIWAVMRAESNGDVRAVSHAGAMGLMQIMPATWAELRVRYRLGPDPFDPRDNIMAGAAYLRELHDRFGAPGFLAAYNAGPARYADHLATGRSLPRETRAYLAFVSARLGFAAPVAVAHAAPAEPARPETLFVAVRPAGDSLFFPLRRDAAARAEVQE